MASRDLHKRVEAGSVSSSFVSSVASSQVLCIYLVLHKCCLNWIVLPPRKNDAPLVIMWCLENSSDLDARCVWLWARLSISLVFISSVKWSEWIRCFLRTFPAPKRYNNPVILKFSLPLSMREQCLCCSSIPLQKVLYPEEEVWTFHRQLSVPLQQFLLSSEKEILKYIIFSPQNWWRRRGGNAKKKTEHSKHSMFFIGFYLKCVCVCVRVFLSTYW